jgi:hypothetical protein
MTGAVQALPEQEEFALQAMLLDPDAETKKTALQRLCDLRRGGFILRRPHAFRIILGGLLNNDSPKVVRWTFAALSRMGSRNEVVPIANALDRHRDNPLAFSTGVTALFALSPSEQACEILRAKKIERTHDVVLASLQLSDGLRDELSGFRINPDHEPPHLLVLTLMLLGLERAPEHLFSARAVNADVVGILNGHQDDLVAQYSVWSLTENPRLGLSHLRTPLADVPSRAPNIRARIYTLVAQDAETPEQRRDFIQAASLDSHPEARRGLARGLRGVFYPGLERLVLEWFAEETLRSNQQLLLEHMASAADQSPAYVSAVLEAYRNAAPGSPTCTRLEAAAAGTAMHDEFRKLAFARESLESPNLRGTIGREVIMVKQDISISGSNNVIGSLVGVGSNNSGSATVVGGDMGSPELANTLEEVVRILEAGQLPEPVAQEGLKLAEQAKAKPDRSTVGKLADWLKSAAEGGAKTLSAAGALGQLATRVSALLP